MNLSEAFRKEVVDPVLEFYAGQIATIISEDEEMVRKLIGETPLYVTLSELDNETFMEEARRHFPNADFQPWPVLPTGFQEEKELNDLGQKAPPIKPHKPKRKKR